jgi:hypothetical protein
MTITNKANLVFLTKHIRSGALGFWRRVQCRERADRNPFFKSFSSQSAYSAFWFSAGIFFMPRNRQIPSLLDCIGSAVLDVHTASAPNPTPRVE